MRRIEREREVSDRIHTYIDGDGDWVGKREREREIYRVCVEEREREGERLKEKG